MNIQLYNFLKLSQKSHRFQKIPQIYNFSTASQKKLNFYEILEIKKSCTQKDLKSQFLKLAKIYHPDIYKGSDKERFRLIKEAYETLRKPALRKKYDQQLREKNFGRSSSETDSTGDAYEDFKQEFEEEQKKKKDRSATFKYDGAKFEEQEDVDLKEEYKKFFEEPIKISPEEVVTHEGVMERQLGFEERVRYEYAHIRNNQDLYTLKYAHQQDFNSAVDDTISMMNAKNTPDSVIKEQERKWHEKLDKWKWVALIGFFVVSVPFMVSHTRRKRQIKDNLIKDSELFMEQEKEKDMYELHDRIRFEHRFEEDKQGIDAAIPRNSK